MITFEHEVYEAIVSDDFNSTRTYGYYTDKLLAEEQVKGKSSWGSDGTVRAKKISIVIFETRQDIEDYDNKTAREKALAKLTPAEIEILGITDEPKRGGRMLY